MYRIRFFLHRTIGISYFFFIHESSWSGGYRQTMSLKDAIRVIGPEQPRSSLSCPAGRGGNAPRRTNDNDEKKRNGDEASSWKKNIHSSFRSESNNEKEKKRTGRTLNT